MFTVHEFARQQILTMEVIMKTTLLAFCFLPTCGNLYSQIDTSAARFFPVAIGNAWHYQDQPVKTITRDSIVEGHRFLFFNTSTDPEFTIDSALNVVQYPTNPYQRRLRYKLNANLMEWWTVQDEDTTIGRPAVIARVESTFLGSLFGVPTQMKAIGFYFDQEDTTILFWRNEEYLAAGFGFFLSFYDPPWVPYEELVGCIIDGRRYGTLVSVNDNISRVIPLSPKLYPCFPDPFNPSTTISYFLSKSGRVNVSVYDILGRKVITLLEDSQDTGSHSHVFQPVNLPSGVYFVRLTARSFTATTKVIYSK
jgi:hypothetical protein